ncbi:hypothetical protein CVT25_009222 [Psilocybe cyanescens]|uniref:Uncharacterized protein n=1 Tax=Psilocybe cyanescens TaxID=93625 RepID=A0A409WWK7_PSICY|nr:hypothetical protein CVT25_009222 [Psilocybe cyanescens]
MVRTWVRLDELRALGAASWWRFANCAHKYTRLFGKKRQNVMPSSDQGTAHHKKNERKSYRTYLPTSDVHGGQETAYGLEYGEFAEKSGKQQQMSVFAIVVPLPPSLLPQFIPPSNHSSLHPFL